MQSILSKLSLQFLCGLPISELSFSDVSLTLEDQEVLLNATVNSDLVLKYPLKIDYQKSFLKHILNNLEKQGLDVHEDLYLTYGRLVAVSELKPEYYKHYKIGDSSTIISLKENIHLVSDGTTGLRTWQASIALAEWCLNNKKSLFKKNILELGSGIGFAGLVASLECQPSKFLFSDCHPGVLETLCENIELNCKTLVTKDIGKSDDKLVLKEQIQNDVSLSVLNIPWEKVNDIVCERIGRIDFILAADVVYDIELFKPLINTLRCISERCQVEDIVFACTERNTHTLELFLNEIGQLFKISNEDCPSQRNFTWSLNPPVKLFRFELL